VWRPASDNTPANGTIRCMGSGIIDAC